MSKSIVLSVACFVIAIGGYFVDVAQAGKPSQQDIANYGKSRRFAFLVGVADYANLQQLPCTKNDVDELATELKNLRFNDVRKLVNPATKADILNALRAYVTSIGQLDPTDTFLIFYSGHGAMLVETPDGSRPQEMSCTVPAEFEFPNSRGLSLADQLVTLNELYDIIDDGTKDGRRIVILDACRIDLNKPQPKASEVRVGVSGKNTRFEMKGVNDTKMQFGYAEAIHPNYAVVKSCDKDQKSYENLALGRGHGYFTYNMLRYLRGQDRAQTGSYLTLANMVSFTAKSTASDVDDLIRRNTEGVDTRQVPKLKTGEATLEEWVLGDHSYNRDFRGDKNLASNPKFLALLRTGKISNYDLSSCDMTGLDFTDVVVRNSLLVNVVADRVCFKESRLWNVDFTGARMHGADFTDADVANSTFNSIVGDFIKFYNTRNTHTARFGGSTQRHWFMGLSSRSND